MNGADSLAVMANCRATGVQDVFHPVRSISIGQRNYDLRISDKRNHRGSVTATACPSLVAHQDQHHGRLAGKPTNDWVEHRSVELPNAIQDVGRPNTLPSPFRVIGGQLGGPNTFANRSAVSAGPSIVKAGVSMRTR